MARRPFLSLVGALAIVVAACGGPGASNAPSGAAPSGGAPSGDASGAPASAGGAGPDRLVIGFVPSREASALVETIQPIADHLSQELDMEVEGFVSTDYTAMVNAIGSGQAHIAALAPFTIVQAIDEYDAELLLQSERNGSATYHTQFMTNNPDQYCTISPPVENERESEINPGTFMNCNGTERGPEDTPEGPIGTEVLADIPAGTTVSFVEESSASGYIFPVTVLANAGIDINEGIERLFAGAHDASAIAVCEGDAEVGVSFDDARSEATSECDLQSEVVVFAYGDEIPNDGIVVAGDLPDELKADIKAALMGYAETEEGGEVLQTVYNISAFAEPNVDALQIVRDAAANLPE